MIKTNLFSGHTYVKTGNTLTSDTGDTCNRVGDCWFGQDGEIIQKQGRDWVNLHTGVRSTFGDPFMEDDDD